MERGQNRLTIVVTKEVEALLAAAKKSRFYDRTQSAMIRELVRAGLEAGERGERSGGA